MSYRHTDAPTYDADDGVLTPEQESAARLVQRYCAVSSDDGVPMPGGVPFGGDIEHCAMPVDLRLTVGGQWFLRCRYHGRVHFNDTETTNRAG